MLLACSLYRILCIASRVLLRQSEKLLSFGHRLRAGGVSITQFLSLSKTDNPAGTPFCSNWSCVHKTFLTSFDLPPSTLRCEIELGSVLTASGKQLSNVQYLHIQKCQTCFCLEEWPLLSRVQMDSYKDRCVTLSSQSCVWFSGY